MFTFEWKPKDTDESLFDGSVTIKVPNHMVRLAFLKELGTMVLDTGEMVQDKKLELSSKLIEFAMKQIEKVALVRKSDGMIVTEKEWLFHDVDGSAILGEIGNSLINGVKLGKN